MDAVLGANLALLLVGVDGAILPGLDCNALVHIGANILTVP